MTSRSSSESELISAADAAAELLAYRNYLISRNFPLKQVILYQDNTASLSILKNGISSAKKMKHIEHKYFFVADRIKAGELNVDWLNTHVMASDYLTKPLHDEKFKLFKNMMLGNINFITTNE